MLAMQDFGVVGFDDKVGTRNSLVCFCNVSLHYSITAAKTEAKTVITPTGWRFEQFEEFFDMSES